MRRFLAKIWLNGNGCVHLELVYFCLLGKEADAMNSRWKRVEIEHAGDSVAFARFCYEESVQLIESIRSLPGEFDISYFVHEVELLRFHAA